MIKLSAIRTGVGIFGQLTSAALFLAPCATIWKIFKRKDVEEFSPNPYLAGIMNCLMWIFYGLPFVTGNNTLVITINSAGLVLELLYVAIFCWFCKEKKQRGMVGLKAFVLALIFALAAFFELKFDKSKATRGLVAGIQSTVFSICLYGMPLDVMWTVIKTKSAEYMPAPLCAAGLANGIVWSIYAVISKPVDKFILIANGMGALLGVFQLVLCYMYRNGPKSGEKNQVELSNKENSIV